MADSARNSSSPVPDANNRPAMKEDAATAEARHELDQTAISQTTTAAVPDASTSDQQKSPPPEKSTANKDTDAPENKDEAASAASPSEKKQLVQDTAETKSTDESTSASSETLDTKSKQRGSNQKKKRTHDQVDKEPGAEESDGQSESSVDSAKDRTLRSEPEKKRHRDEVAEVDEKPFQNTNEKHTSHEAFSKSSFAQLASSSSPFGALAGAKQNSVFGSKHASSSSSSTATAPKLSFASAGASSPFGTLPELSGFGSALGGKKSVLGGGGFGSGFGGFASSGAPGKLSSFAKPGESLKQDDKTAKPFGAPDSESEGEEDGDDADAKSVAAANDEQDTKDENKAEAEKEDEKKRLRLQKVAVDDGEAGEVTMIQVRAKVFGMENKDAGWKERGSGMLKVNVPEEGVQFDETGNPIPGSFEAAYLGQSEDAEKGESSTTKQVMVPRLILRQDQTHRMLLNTAIRANMEFQEKATLKAVNIMITAYEGLEAKPVSILLKMSAASARTFLAEVSSIQEELRG